jgi:uncharacterized protein YbjT (DUF2867 family)
MSTSKLVLVTGATGKQGGAVVDALLRRGHRVRALTRRPASAAATRLRARGASVVGAAPGDVQLVARAARGVDALFAVTTSIERGTGGEIDQGAALVDAAVAARVPHLVLSSMASADRATGVPPFERKLAIERHARASGAPCTIIAPVFFMENLLARPTAADLAQGRLAMALPAARSLQQIAVADIGGFAASVIERGDPVVGRRFDIAGDELTGEQAACILSDVLGRRVRYRGIPPAALAAGDQAGDQAGDPPGSQADEDDRRRVFEWLDRDGHAAAIEDLRDDFPEVGWHDFEGWARKQNWSTACGE